MPGLREMAASRMGKKKVHKMAFGGISAPEAGGTTTGAEGSARGYAGKLFEGPTGPRIPQTLREKQQANSGSGFDTSGFTPENLLTSMLLLSQALPGGAAAPRVMSVLGKANQARGLGGVLGRLGKGEVLGRGGPKSGQSPLAGASNEQLTMKALRDLAGVKGK